MSRWEKPSFRPSEWCYQGGGNAPLESPSRILSIMSSVSHTADMVVFSLVVGPGAGEGALARIVSPELLKTRLCKWDLSAGVAVAPLG